MRFSKTAAAVLAIELIFAFPAQAGDIIPPVASPPSSGAVSPQYLIGPDDQLDVLVYQVPELTRIVQVDSGGEFILPLVGRVQAAGHTADEIATILTGRLSGKYLKDPQITVIVKQAVSQRVTVEGAVTKPGVYTLSGPTSLLQALALANGPDLRIANIKKVAIFRTVAGQRKGQVFDVGRIEKGNEPDPAVKADDIVIVDRSGTKSFFTYFGSALSFLSLVPLL